MAPSVAADVAPVRGSCSCKIRHCCKMKTPRCEICADLVEKARMTLQGVMLSAASMLLRGCSAARRCSTWMLCLEDHHERYDMGSSPSTTNDTGSSPLQRRLHPRLPKRTPGPPAAPHSRLVRSVPVPVPAHYVTLDG